MYISDKLISSEVVLSCCECSELEQIWCRVGSGSEAILVGRIYRPGNARNNEEIDTSLHVSEEQALLKFL